LRKVVKKNGKPLLCKTYSEQEYGEKERELLEQRHRASMAEQREQIARDRLHAETERANAACRKLALLRTIVEQA
jgi:hypothetical protein